MFNAIPIKIPMIFITEIEKSTLKFIWKHKRLQLAKAILSKKNNARGISIPNFKLYYGAIAIKPAWYWHKNRHEDKRNRIQDPDMNLCNYIHLIFNKGVKNIRWRKDRLFNKCCWENWSTICKKLKLDPYISLSINTNSKRIEDLSIRPETLKLLQKGAGNTLEQIGTGKDFLNRTPVVQQLKESYGQMGLHKTKKLVYNKGSSLYTEETTDRVGENTFQLNI
jgi:hypothetical protein